MKPSGCGNWKTRRSAEESYESQRSDEELRGRLRQLAREKPRFGYRRLHVLLRREGEMTNHKRVYRVYREAGLCLRRTACV